MAYFPTTSSPRGKAIKYNQQFPKDFMRPYGEAVDPELISSDELYHRRLKSFTCEWLQRPGIAISELADTVNCNPLTKWSKDLSLLQNPSLQQQFSSHMDKLRQLLQPFNNKGDNTSFDMTASQTLEKFKKIWKHLAYNNEMFKTYTEQLVTSGAAMYLVGIHLRVAMNVVNNMTQVATLSSGQHNLTAFMKDPTVETYASAIHEDQRSARATTSTSRASSSRRSLESFLASSSRTSSAPIAPPSSSRPVQQQQVRAARKRKATAKAEDDSTKKQQKSTL